MDCLGREQRKRKPLQSMESQRIYSSSPCLKGAPLVIRTAKCTNQTLCRYRWDFRSIKSVTSGSESVGEHPPPATFHFNNGESFTVPFVVYASLTKAPESTVTLLSDPSMSVVKESMMQPNPMFKIPMGEIPNSGLFPKSAMDGVYVCGNAGTFMSTVVWSQSQGQLAGVGCDNEIGMEDQADALKACL